MQPIPPYAHIIQQNNDAGYVIIAFNGATYRVYSCGSYDQLVELPLAALRKSPAEPQQNQTMVDAYAEKYRNGSPFPPIDVVGLWPGREFYRIVNGHHRYEAALQCGCETILAWTDFSAPAPGMDFYRPANLPDTETGRHIAEYLGWRWCPECKSLLGYNPATGHCHKCALDHAALATTAVA